MQPAKTPIRIWYFDVLGIWFLFLRALWQPLFKVSIENDVCASDILCMVLSVLCLFLVLNFMYEMSKVVLVRIRDWCLVVSVGNRSSFICASKMMLCSHNHCRQLVHAFLFAWLSNIYVENTTHTDGPKILYLMTPCTTFSVYSFIFRSVCGDDVCLHVTVRLV